MLDFMGIGAQKSGTTWLYESLRGHPQVRFPLGKEVHYWNQYAAQQLDHYLAQFSGAGFVNGEITPAYAILPLDTIRTIHSVLPALRIVYLIRNPAHRAWSAAGMAVARADLTHDECSDQWFIDHFRSHGSMARGDYETCIRNWREVFPPEQILVMRHDFINQDPLAAVNRVAAHIGLRHGFDASDLPRLQQRVFEGSGMAIRPRLLPVLRDLYARRVDSLARYLQEDFSAWKQF